MAKLFKLAPEPHEADGGHDVLSHLYGPQALKGMQNPPDGKSRGQFGNPRASRGKDDDGLDD